MIDPNAYVTAIVGRRGRADIVRVRIGDWFDVTPIKIIDVWDDDYKYDEVHVERPVLTPKRGIQAHCHGWHGVYDMVRLRTKEGLTARFIGSTRYWPEYWRADHVTIKYRIMREFPFMGTATNGRVAYTIFDMDARIIATFRNVIDPGAYAIATADMGVDDDDLQYDDIGGDEPLDI